VSDAAERLWGVVEPYVAAEGVELDDLLVVGNGRGRVVRVILDAEEPLGVERIADLSRGISRLMDDDDPLQGSYTLEVGSPGLERPLRRPEHYRKSLGREVTVKTRREIAGSRRHRGLLEAAGDSDFEIDSDGTPLRIPYDAVEWARTIFTWSRSPKPGTKA
jgi:ribosome maturation factor RimP